MFLSKSNLIVLEILFSISVSFLSNVPALRPVQGTGELRSGVFGMSFPKDIPGHLSMLKCGSRGALLVTGSILYIASLDRKRF